jgi:hypothetical protein
MGKQPMTAMIDQVERYHCRARRDKTLDPPLRRRCSSPHCRTGWEAEPDGPYCLHCHQLVKDRGDELRARKERKRREHH